MATPMTKWLLGAKSGLLAMTPTSLSGPLSLRALVHPWLQLTNGGAKGFTR